MRCTPAGIRTASITRSRFMDEGVCTNQAESYFSRLRRMEVGTHHHIAGPYLERLRWRGFVARG